MISLSDHFSRFADEIRALGERHRARNDARAAGAAEMATWRAKQRAAIRLLIAAIRRGDDLAGAIPSIASDLDMREAAVKTAAKTAAKAAERLTRGERDREITRLAWRGLKNTEIADQLGIHRNTVSRVIRRALAARPAPSGRPGRET